MAVVALDDTDSRERGMCTTYVAAVLGERLRQSGVSVERSLLVRCNPAVEHKTRGNAAVALHLAASGGDLEASALDEVEATARETIDELAATADPRTNPGLVIAPEAPAAVGADVAAFARDAVRDHYEIEDAVALAERAGYRTASWGNGRGRIGALAAVGAWRAREEWTYERIAYRRPERWGSERDVDEAAVRAAADDAYPTVWDSVDRTAEAIVCVPHTPGPVLFGIRGDDPDAVESTAASIDGEAVERAVTFVTNQGTDAHVRPEPDGPLRDGRAYAVDGVVRSEPETRAGGHVFLAIERTGAAASGADGAATAAPGADGAAATAAEEPDADGRLDCVAFEPTKRFRDRVRDLRRGDRVTVVGEVDDGTLKLEKFALRDAVRTERANPTCPDCGRSMESAGADQGYRCRDCGTAADEPDERQIDRTLEPGWYEVPPLARRHVAKPLVRGGFDAATHPER